jgi:hypothetical protein
MIIRVTLLSYRQVASVSKKISDDSAGIALRLSPNPGENRQGERPTALLLIDTGGGSGYKGGKGYP